MGQVYYIAVTDIETAQKCERMFYYARILRLRPKQLFPWLKRGSFGHDCMETGFQVIIDGGTEQEAAEVIAAGPLQRLLDSGDPDTAEMMKVYRHVITFISFTQTDKINWRPVALEDTGMWNLDKKVEHVKIEGESIDDLVFAYTPDLIIEFTQGLYKGQHAVLDYKFLGQYMSEDAVNMAQQIPKYIIYRNKVHTDYKIRRGAFIQLNTRATPDATGHKLFLIKWVEPSKKRLERIEYENEEWVGRVASLYAKPQEQLLRTVNKDVCDKCFFTELCSTEFDGKPIEKIIQREYVRNEYGY